MKAVCANRAHVRIRERLRPTRPMRGGDPLLYEHLFWCAVFNCVIGRRAFAGSLVSEHVCAFHHPPAIACAPSGRQETQNSSPRLDVTEITRSNVDLITPVRGASVDTVPTVSKSSDSLDAERRRDCSMSEKGRFAPLRDKFSKVPSLTPTRARRYSYPMGPRMSSGLRTRRSITHTTYANTLYNGTTNWGLQQACNGAGPKENNNQSRRNSRFPKVARLPKAQVRALATRAGNGDLVVPLRGEGGQPATVSGTNADVASEAVHVRSGKTSAGTHSENVGFPTQLWSKVDPYQCYQLLCQPNIYKLAYSKIKSNPGNMTPGLTGETLDGFSNRDIEQIVASMKDRSFAFKPSRRIWIPKPNGKLRPLGVPCPRDKIVQSAMKLILEELYEPIFLDCSHGFRPNRGCHTALEYVKSWMGITWAVEGDIKGFFDHIDHHKLAQLLESRVKDKNFIDLYWKLVNAGYVNLGENYTTHSITGVPQGGVLRPLLSNIYLHQLDLYITENLLPQYHQEGIISETTREYEIAYNDVCRSRRHLSKLRQAYKEMERENREEQRQEQSHQIKVQQMKLRLKEKDAELRAFTNKLRKTPSKRRIRTRMYYVRYADDWLIGIAGTKNLAQQIRQQVGGFLHTELLLTLNQEKTLLTHMTRSRAKFLGTEISVTDRRYAESQIKTISLDKKELEAIKTQSPKELEGKKTYQPKCRMASGRIRMRAPIRTIVTKLKEKGFAKRIIIRPAGKEKIVPCAFTKWVHLPLTQMMEKYESVLRGYLNFYSFADNYSNLHSVKYILKYSLVCTMARKLRLNTAKVHKKYGRAITVIQPDGKKRTLDFPTSLKKGEMRFQKARHKIFDPLNFTLWQTRTHRLLDSNCWICGSGEHVEMHHVRALRDAKTNTFKARMKAMNRKQIPVCHLCHRKIHRGEYDGTALTLITEQKDSPGTKPR